MLSECVLGKFPFDASESDDRRASVYNLGNRNYAESNIFSFLNSKEDEWFQPMNANDRPPIDRNIACARYYWRGASRVDEFAKHAGFLKNFHDYEINSVISDINLPSKDEIMSWPYFKRNGKRPHPTAEYIRLYSEDELNSDCFCDFWLRTTDMIHKEEAMLFARNGQFSHEYPYHARGIRPTCRLSASTVVESTDDGVFVIKKSNGTRSDRRDKEEAAANICDLFSALGLGSSD